MHIKDRQVPQCPLCQALITVQADQSVDFVVSRHIDTDCISDVARKRRVSATIASLLHNYYLTITSF